MTGSPTNREGHVVCFGELLMRLATAPGHLLADALNVHIAIGGAEANVGVALTAMGHDASIVSRVPANALGDKARGSLAGAGLDVRHLTQAPGSRMGLYFLEVGASLRPSAIVYDRAGSAFATARPEDFEFAAALDGAALLHVSGITPALGPNGVQLARAAIRAASVAGVPVSFDCNFRESLWNAWECNPREILLELLAEATIVFGNHRDMTLLLGRPFSGEDETRRREAAEAAFAYFPKLVLMASTTRTAVTQTHHRIAARVDLRDDHHQTATLDVPEIVDRIGSGDAFAAGVLTGWLEQAGARRMAELGLAMNVLKHSVHGDWLRLPRSEIDAFTGRSGDVRR